MSTKINQPLVIPRGSFQLYRSVIAPHFHSRAQLLYASEGSIRVQTHQNIWIVPPQYALWIPAFVEHSVTSLSQVRLSTVLVEEKASLSVGNTCFLIKMTNLLRELVLRLNLTNELHPDHYPYSEELEKSLQLLIFHEIQQATTFPIEIPWPKDIRLISICEALLEHPHNVKDLNTWADMIGTSPRTLIRLFQKETGLPYRTWIQQMHLALALGKLSRGEPVSRIANSLGYKSTSAFSAMFKKHLGESPQSFGKN
nr:helix-turn-helix transcriptional regulator [Acinetobacter sp. Marseille-Q1620]